MREVGVLEAKTNLSALLSEVERGAGDITITRHGKPVARLTTMEHEQNSVPRLSGPELAERFRLLRARISSENPETDQLTWEELKAMARE